MHGPAITSMSSSFLLRVICIICALVGAFAGCIYPDLCHDGGTKVSLFSSSSPAALSLCERPEPLTVDPLSGTLYAACKDKSITRCSVPSQTAVFSLAGSLITPLIAAEECPCVSSLVLSPVTGKLYALCSQWGNSNRHVHIIDPTNASPARSIPFVVDYRDGMRFSNLVAVSRSSAVHLRVHFNDTYSTLFRMVDETVGFEPVITFSESACEYHGNDPEIVSSSSTDLIYWSCVDRVLVINVTSSSTAVVVTTLSAPADCAADGCTAYAMTTSWSLPVVSVVWSKAGTSTVQAYLYREGDLNPYSTYTFSADPHQRRESLQIGLASQAESAFLSVTGSAITAVQLVDSTGRLRGNWTFETSSKLVLAPWAAAYVYVYVNIAVSEVVALIPDPVSQVAQLPAPIRSSALVAISTLAGAVYVMNVEGTADDTVYSSLSSWAAALSINGPCFGLVSHPSSDVIYGLCQCCLLYTSDAADE